MSDRADRRSQVEWVAILGYRDPLRLAQYAVVDTLDRELLEHDARADVARPIGALLRDLDEDGVAPVVRLGTCRSPRRHRVVARGG